MALIAERDSVGIGFILVLRLDVFAHIFEVGVRQSHQGQGIGRRLIAMAEDWAKQQALSEITLTTFPDVSWNGPFYQKLGFKEFSPGKDRPELQAIIDYEASSGFAQARRITMRKDLF